MTDAVASHGSTIDPGKCVIAPTAKRARRRECRRARHRDVRDPRGSDYGRASSTRLNGVSVARRKRVKPASSSTSRRRASPACAPSAAPTSWASELRADERRGRVEEAAERVEVLLDAVAGERLDEQPGAVRPSVAHVRGGADRVAHVVQAVEERDEVVALPGNSFAARDLEASPDRRRPPRARARARARSTARGSRSRRSSTRERLRHDDRRRAVPAADVGDARAALELRLRRRRGPGSTATTRLRVVAGTEEPLGALEETGSCSCQPTPLPVRNASATSAPPHRRRHALEAAETGRALVVRQRDRLLRRQCVAPSRRRTSRSRRPPGR